MRCEACGDTFYRSEYNEYSRSPRTCPRCTMLRQAKKRKPHQTEYMPTPESPIGTTLGAVADCTFEKLLWLFGDPNGMTDNTQTIYRWVMRDCQGDMVTIYDWLATSNYRSDLPSVKEFQLSSYRWRIGCFCGSALEAAPPAVRLRKFILDAPEPTPEVKPKKYQEHKVKAIRAIELED